MEISIFSFNPKLRHYTGLKKQYTVSFKENSLKRDTLILNSNSNNLKDDKTNIKRQKDKKTTTENKQKIYTKNTSPEKNNYIESSRYWDLKYNNLI